VCKLRRSCAAQKQRLPERWMCRPAQSRLTVRVLVSVLACSVLSARAVVRCPGIFGVADVTAVVFVTGTDMTENESAVEYGAAGVPIMNF
jgi:hypothetical protein